MFWKTKKEPSYQTIGEAMSDIHEQHLESEARRKNRENIEQRIEDFLGISFMIFVAVVPLLIWAAQH